MKKVDFDHYAEDYSLLLHQQTAFFVSNEAYFARYKVGIVRKHLAEEPRRVLEFGCGIGRNIPFLRDALPSAEIMGSDVSAHSIEVARAENPGVSFWVEGEETVSQGGFDLIFVAGVFHHISPAERETIVRLLFSRLASGGTLFVFEHNPYNPVTRRIVSTCPYDEDAVLLRPGELRELLCRGGLEVQRRAFSLFLPPRFKMLFPLEDYLGWLPLGGQYWMQARRP